MNSFEVRKDTNGQAYKVTIEKDKTLWMKLFKVPCKITYDLRGGLWYNETYDRLAKCSESNDIDWRIAQMESRSYVKHTGDHLTTYGTGTNLANKFIRNKDNEK